MSDQPHNGHDLTPEMGDFGLTPPEQITAMAVRVNGAGGSTWTYSMAHKDAANILREIADQIDLKAAEAAEAAEAADE